MIQSRNTYIITSIIILTHKYDNIYTYYKRTYDCLLNSLFYALFRKLYNLYFSLLVKHIS